MAKLTGQKTGRAKVDDADYRPKRFRLVNYGGQNVELVTDWNKDAHRFFKAKLKINGQEAVVDRDELISYLSIQ